MFNLKTKENPDIGHTRYLVFLGFKKNPTLSYLSLNFVGQGKYIDLGRKYPVTKKVFFLEISTKFRQV